jgi:hypothetical protein
MIFFLGTYLVATEYISAAKSKGEVLVFRRGHAPPKAKDADDEEATTIIVHDKKAALQDDSDNAVGVIQKQTAIFHWEDVCYDIKIKGEPRRLLDNVDGWVVPGTLTALMVSNNPLSLRLGLYLTSPRSSASGRLWCWQNDFVGRARKPCYYGWCCGNTSVFLHR